MPIEINKAEIQKYFEGKDKDTIPHCIRRDRTFRIKSIGQQSLTVTAGTTLNIIFKYEHLSIVINRFSEYSNDKEINDKEIREFVKKVVVNADVGCRRHLLYAIAREYLDRKKKGIRNTPSTQPKPSGTQEEPDDEFPEGTEVEKTHRKKERNVKLIKEAKNQFKQNNGRLYCEACSFDFEKIYGERAKDFIEAHHNIPISKMDTSGTKITDIAMLCSNCHRIIHRTTPWLSVEDLKVLITKHSKAKR
jgi:predicted HNH restriction endonuclease